MRVTLICIGKTDEKYLQEGIEKYVRRLIHYVKINIHIIPDIKNSKNLNEAQQKAKEAEQILKYISPQDTVILLDEKGKEFTSIGFSAHMEKSMVGGVQHMIFIIGGPYGFDDSLYTRSNQLFSLSKMTFSHQMVRLFFVEQLYRSFTILKGEPYHHV